MQIRISCLLQKPTDLDLHCLQRQGISGFSRARVNSLPTHLHLNVFKDCWRTGRIDLNHMPQNVEYDLGLQCCSDLSVQILRINKEHTCTSR